MAAYSTPPNLPGLSSWQWLYVAALQENNILKLFKRVEIAEAAILTRRETLPDTIDCREERRLIAEALATLQAIKIDRLQFR